MERRNVFASAAALLRRPPQAAAKLLGSPAYPSLAGEVRFYQRPWGVLVAAEISGLPRGEGPDDSGFFAFHIHSGCTCTGNGDDPFAGAQGHYDPLDRTHPNHAGDLPPILSSRRRGLLIFETSRFTLQEVIGRTVILHSHRDDFTTQPAGHAGEKIACGVIRSLARPQRKKVTE